MKRLLSRYFLSVGLVLLTVIILPAVVLAETDPQEIARQAFEMRMEGQLDQAVALLENTLAEAPEAGVLHYELARARMQLLDIKGMHEEARAAVELAPANSDYRYFSAIAAAYALIDAAHHNDQERMEELGKESLEQLSTILEHDPDYHQARFMLVQLSVDMAPDLGLQVEATEPHVVFLEKNDPILGAKARCCLVNEEEQGEIWRNVLTDHPGDCRALCEAAAGLVQAGDLDLAEKCLSEVMAKDRHQTYGLLGLGLAYCLRQEWDRGIALTQRYLETDPPVALKAYATGRLGMIHHRMGKPDEARKHMEAARKLDPHVWQTMMPPPEEIFQPI